MSSSYTNLTWSFNDKCGSFSSKREELILIVYTIFYQSPLLSSPLPGGLPHQEELVPLAPQALPDFVLLGLTNYVELWRIINYIISNSHHSYGFYTLAGRLQKYIFSHAQPQKQRPLKESQIDKQVKSPIVYITVFMLKKGHFIDSNSKT